MGDTLQYITTEYCLPLMVRGFVSQSIEEFHDHMVGFNIEGIEVVEAL